MRPSTVAYFCCYLNLFCSVVFALNHELFWMLFSFGFAVWNWYTAEARREVENETNKDGEPTDSDSDSGNDETKE